MTRQRAGTWAAVFGLLLGGACSDGGNGPRPPDQGIGDAGTVTKGPPGSWSAACGDRVNQPPGPSTAPYCPPIDEMAAWIVGQPECPDQVYPTERELACNGAKLPRKELPATVVSTELDWGNLPDRADGAQLMSPGSARWIFTLTDALDASGVPRDMVAPAISGLPPFFRFQGPNGTVDLVAEKETFEASLRSYGANLLRERAKGKIGLFGYSLGPHEPQPPETTDPGVVEAAIQTIMVPRVAAAAKVAELVNAEVFLPFPGEADLLATISGLRGIAPAERFRLVQLLVDTVLATTKRYFTGKIMGASAWRYYPSDHPLYSPIDMSQINWRGFDFVEFTLLIATNDLCDPDFTRAFLSAQTATISAMAARDHFGWGSVEIDLFTFNSVSTIQPTGGCTTPPRDAFFPVLDAVFDGMLAAPTRPAFLIFPNGPSAWSTDTAFHTELKTKLTTFATAIKTPK